MEYSALSKTNQRMGPFRTETYCSLYFSPTLQIKQATVKRFIDGTGGYGIKGNSTQLE